MKIHFKQIEIKDLEQVLHLFKRSAEKIKKMDIDHWQYWTNPPAEKIRWVEDGINNQEFFFIQTPNQDPIGMVRIMDEDVLYWGKQAEKAKYIHSLVVREHYNGQGMGQRIIETIGEQAKLQNCRYLRLDSDAKNPKLCSYYEKLGFKKVGIQELPLSTYNLYEKELH